MPMPSLSTSIVKPVLGLFAFFAFAIPMSRSSATVLIPGWSTSLASIEPVFEFLTAMPMPSLSALSVLVIPIFGFYTTMFIPN